MGDWDEHQQQFINKLADTEQLFNEIFEKDADGLIINGSERQLLLELSKRNNTILNKLKSKEFTVAVVGLEKAGKSTLGNALIKRLVLPEFEERCTYTTTEIRYGAVDEAIVSFYTREEFNKRLKIMFDEIEYDGEVDIAAMKLETFKKYWAAIKDDPKKANIFERYNGTIAVDITDILNGKEELMTLLDQPDKKFEPDEWSTYKFQIYITGVVGRNPDKTVIRRAHVPHAVKNVVIRAEELGDMKNIVLYDVPGFDSPTKLHKEQTLKMLTAADAIILVVNTGTNPNLTSTQIDMLLKGATDSFGVKLSEKAFVFGNRLDMVASLQVAQSNLNALRKDVVEKFHIASDAHVLGGSARACLEAQGLIKDVIAKPKIDEWQMSDGVEELHRQMQYYYDHDRYAVLKKKAEGTLKDAEKFLRNLLEQYTPAMLARQEAGGEHMLHAKNQLHNFIEQSNELIRERLEKIHDEAPFSNSLKDNIDKIYPLIEDAYAPTVRKIENSLVIEPDNVYQTTKVDGEIREQLQVVFIKNIVTEVARLTEGRQAELRNELVENFLENMEMPTNSRFRAELEQSVNKLFDELLIDGGAQCYFNPLVERFTTTLIEALILSPFATEERFKKIKINLPEFISLAVYYSANENNEQKLAPADNSDERLNFFSKLLTHEGFETPSRKSSAESAANNDALNRNVKLIKGFFSNINDQYIKKWARQFADADIKFDGNMQSVFRQKLDDKIKNVNWNQLSSTQQMQMFDDIIGELCRGKTPMFERNKTDRSRFQSTAKGNQLEDLHERGKELKTMRSKEDMIATLDADIMILRDITVKAVIKAIGLERAFISVIAKNANLIRTSLEKEPVGYEKFDKWILNNIHKLKEFEFEEIDRRNQSSDTRRRIVNSIQQLLDKM